MDTNKMKNGFVLVWGALILLLFLCIECSELSRAFEQKDTYKGEDSSDFIISEQGPRHNTDKMELYENAATEDALLNDVGIYAFAGKTRIKTVEANGKIYLPINELMESCSSGAEEWPEISYSKKYNCLMCGERCIRADVYLTDGTVNISVEDAITLFEAQYDCGILLDMKIPNGDITHYDSEALTWLAAIINAEARGECFDGKLAVGTVVLNRVDSELYPDTVKDVVFDRKYGVQFSPTESGSIYMPPTDESLTAAKICLEGYRTDTDILFFYNPKISDSTYFKEKRTYEFSIGNHEFFS